MTDDLTLSQGRPYLAIPGPSVVPDEVLRAMHRASPNIYEGALVDMTAGTIAQKSGWRSACARVQCLLFIPVL